MSGKLSAGLVGTELGAGKKPTVEEKLISNYSSSNSDVSLTYRKSFYEQENENYQVTSGNQTTKQFIIKLRCGETVVFEKPYKDEQLPEASNVFNSIVTTLKSNN